MPLAAYRCPSRPDLMAQAKAVRPPVWLKPGRAVLFKAGVVYGMGYSDGFKLARVQFHAWPADHTLHGARGRINPDDGVDKDVLHPERAIRTSNGVTRTTLRCWQVVESKARCGRCGEGELSHKACDHGNRIEEHGD